MPKNASYRDGAGRIPTVKKNNSDFPEHMVPTMAPKGFPEHRKADPQGSNRGSMEAHK